MAARRLRSAGWLCARPRFLDAGPFAYMQSAQSGHAGSRISQAEASSEGCEDTAIGWLAVRPAPFSGCCPDRLQAECTVRSRAASSLINCAEASSEGCEDTGIGWLAVRHSLDAALLVCRQSVQSGHNKQTAMLSLAGAARMPCHLLPQTLS